MRRDQRILVVVFLFKKRQKTSSLMTVTKERLQGDSNVQIHGDGDFL
jgi:hypothetical protein